MIINGDGGYGVLAAYIGGLAAQAGLVQRSAATWRHCCIQLFIAWTEWTLAVAVQLQWQHYKYRYYYYYCCYYY